MFLTPWAAYRKCLECHLGLVSQDSPKCTFLAHSVTDGWFIFYFFILLQILFPFRLLQNIEQSSLCSTAGPCWLSILNIAVCTCQPDGWFRMKIKETVHLSSFCVQSSFL